MNSWNTCEAVKNGVVYMLNFLIYSSIMAHIKIAVFKPLFLLLAKPMYWLILFPSHAGNTNFEYGCSLMLVK
jgi:hypothetical protein